MGADAAADGSLCLKYFIFFIMRKRDTVARLLR